MTSGIWRPARLEMWDKARIADLYVHQKDVSAAVAHISVEAEVVASDDAMATLSVDYGNSGKRSTASRNVPLTKGINHVTLPIDINQAGTLVSRGIRRPADL